jgi:hypothetical protein
VKQRWWRILVPTLVTIGLVGAAIPSALAGELDNDRANNRLRVRMSLQCNSDHSVTLKWHSFAPRRAASMTAQWYDMTADPNFDHPTPSSKADQVAAVKRRGDRASGSFRIRGVPNRHKIAIFVDAWSLRGGQGDQVFGLGRNIDTIRC